MSLFFTATIYAWASHVLAIIFVPTIDPIPERLRLFLLMAVTAPILFFIHSPLATLSIFFVVLVLITPGSNARKAATYLVAAACLPPSVMTPLPFPGVNYLITLTPVLVAATALLLPIFLTSRAQRSIPLTIGFADICLVMYVLWMSAMLASQVGLTSGMRHAIENSIYLIVPYFAIRSAISCPKDLQIILRGFIIASLFLATISILATFKQWDFYRLLDPPTSTSFQEFRNGYLRINATATVHSLGYHLAAALIVLEAIKFQLSNRRVQLMAIRLILLVGLIYTDSRGTMASLVIGYVALMFINSKNLWMKIAVGSVGASAVLFGAAYLLYADLSQIDLHGTFQYRRDLLHTSLNYVSLHPIFGTYFYELDPMFEHLRQGQGIIDVTNQYLLVALRYGLVGLFLFFASIILPFAGLIRLKAQNEATSPARQLKSIRAALCGAIIGWLLLVVTTSDTGLTLHIGILLAALARATSDLYQTDAGSEELAQADNRTEPSMHGALLTTRG